MKSYNKRYISRADFHALQSLRIPYTGFVKGVGYAYTSFGFIPPAHQHRVNAPTRVPYNQSYQQTTITQLVDTSPEALARSLHLQPDALIKLLVTKRPGGCHNLNLGNGRIEQLSADCQLIREITDTPTGMKYKIGYINKATGKQESTSGYLRDMHITFAKNTSQIAPLEIPGEINLTASQVLMELPTQEKQARQKTSWQPYGWIFTDPNGTASDDATPFRAHKIYILSDALSWISLIGSMARPRANNRSTNFWAWFGKGLEKLGDMGSAMAPREAYGVESEKENNRNQKKDSERNVSRRKASNTRANSNHEYFLENLKIEIRQKTGGYIDSVVTYPNKPDTLYQINSNGDIRQKWIRIHNHFDLLK